MSKLSFNKFLERAFPIKDPFLRNELGRPTNAIKYFAIRASYILYRLGINANQISLFSALLSIPTFVIIYQATFQEPNIFKFFIGYTLICIILFIDFLDGPLSQMNEYKYSVGNDIDNLPPDIAILGSLLIFGMFSNSIFFTALFWANIAFLFTYLRNTINYIPENKEWILRLICSRFSLLSIRVFVATIFPIFCIIYIYNQELASILSKVFILFYVINTAFWIQITLESKQKNN